MALDGAIVPAVGRFGGLFPLKTSLFLFEGGHTVFVLALLQIHSRGGPIPIYLCGFSFGVNGNVAGLAGHVLGVPIEVKVHQFSTNMRFICMTVFA